VRYHLNVATPGRGVDYAAVVWENDDGVRERVRFFILELVSRLEDEEVVINPSVGQLDDGVAG